MKLRIDDDELATCVSCGLCLPHCPTYRVTGEEGLSPRGRIDAMRAVQNRDAPITDDFVRFMETCVQCRGCEPVCPSGVPFGRLMEGTRSTLADVGRMTPWWQRLAFRALGHHRLLLAGSTGIALAQRARLVPRQLPIPRLALRRGRRLRPTGDGIAESGKRVWLFTGCVMDAWMRSTHRSTATVLGAVGLRFDVPGRTGSCCGALHTHAGLTAQSRRLAERVMSSMPGNGPVVVNSAGCGAAMKDYGHLVGTDAARQFSERVIDVHEVVAQHLDDLPPVRSVGRVIVHDPCHLRHVQRTHGAMRMVLAALGEVVELDDDGLCCGAGGAFAALQPELADGIRRRKLAAIERAGGGPDGTVVASANPGCTLHLAAAGVRAEHPMDLLAEALG